MKRVFSSFMMISLVSLSPAAGQDTQSPVKAGTLTVVVSGLKNSAGDVIVGLFDSKESYEGNGQRFKGATIKIENNEAKWEVADIPFGEYAVKVFHDENSDGDIDTNFLGIPTESYGFSNNAKGVLGPPGFDKAKFTLHEQTMRIEIKLN